MSRKKLKPSAANTATTPLASLKDDPVSTVVMLRLYIANNAPNSIRAVANLAEICKEHLVDNFKLEIIDVLEYPQRALADGILVTPSLAKLSPKPTAKIVGNLSDRSTVLHALGVS